MFNSGGSRNFERSFSLTKMPAQFQLKTKEKKRVVVSSLSDFLLTEACLANNTAPKPTRSPQFKCFSLLALSIVTN